MKLMIPFRGHFYVMHRKCFAGILGEARRIFATEPRNRYDGLDLFDERPGAKYWYTGGFSIPGLAAGIIGGAAASFFLTTDFWSGAIAEAMGYIDLSAPVAMIVSGGLYYLFTRRGHTFGDAR
ncbi:hypothetical protein [Leucobacter sp. W1038]|uniref:hypothetical protein n=1 Tax=Leucobacter sp. W1038 TaxID=3438281 RepID=UPI003D96DF58